ncbi:MAG: U32 family peptidase [Clostridiales bacterium]|nr:MAG: U32 family peptidase [Clostridiales bacterium]
MIEILAPAGDLISLKSAIASDTDAVYLGLSAFNARIKAENFTTENIKDTVDYCHLFGVKVYVTINIAVKESEKEELKSIIVACGQANVDAFIITDMLALELAKEFAPKVRLHASTQFGVCNAEGAKFAESLGFFTRGFCPARRQSKKSKIKAETNVEIEYFVHGALCVAFFREMSYVVVH